MQESGKFRRKRINFSQVSNNALHDPTLSLGAKGLYAMIESYINIPDFTLYKTALMKMSKEGRKAFDSSWRSLKEKGYLIQYELRNEKNQIYYEYELLDDPMPPKTNNNKDDKNAGVPFCAYGSAAGTFCDSGKRDSIIINNKNNTLKSNNKINNKSSVVVNKGKSQILDEQLFMNKIYLDKERYILVGLIPPEVADEFDKKVIKLFKSFSTSEQNIINMLPSNKAFDIYYSYISLSGKANDEDEQRSVSNPEGYIRGMVQNLGGA